MSILSIRNIVAEIGNIWRSIYAGIVAGYDVNDIVRVLRTNAAGELIVETNGAGIVNRTTAKGVTILFQASVPAGSTSAIGAGTTLDLTKAVGASITATATFDLLATAGIRIHVRTSYNDNVLNYDDLDYAQMDIPLTVDAAIQKTLRIGSEPLYARVLVENLDLVKAVTVAVRGTRTQTEPI